MSALGLWACNGDDYVLPLDAAADAPSSDATTQDATGDARADSAPDGVADAIADAADAGDADSSAPLSPRLLLSYNAMTSSELAVFDLTTMKVAGDLKYPGFIGTTSTQGPDPYLLEQSVDIVAKLDRAAPWSVVSSWSVALKDMRDGGDAYSDPDAVVVGTPTKAYVLRYTRNDIAIIDPSKALEAGAPTGMIDLSSLVQPAGDGIVEMTAGVYDPSSQRVYVVLGNINRANVSTDGFTLLCSPTKATVVAIDTTQDKLVPGAINLLGYDPVFGGLAFDAAGGRLLVAHAGCNARGDGGTAGPLQQRIVEAVTLSSGATEMLLDNDALGYPSAFVYVDAHHAVMQFDFTGSETYQWDPTQKALGPLIPKAPDAFAIDGAGNLLGLVSTTLADGGAGPLNIVKVNIATGASTTLLASSPFTLTGGFLSGVSLWPPP